MRTNYFLGANGFTGRARARNVETRVFYELATSRQTRNYITPAHAPYREHRTAFPPLTCTSATVSDRIFDKSAKKNVTARQRLVFTLLHRVLKNFPIDLIRREATKRQRIIWKIFFLTEKGSRETLFQLLVLKSLV